MQPTPTPDSSVNHDDDIGFFPNFMRPMVNRVARVKATVHTKLLVGFFTIALLLLGMGIVSIAVLNRVDNQVQTLTTLHEQTDDARQMIYAVTAQSHFRAMAIVTEDPGWNDKIGVAKANFEADMNEIRSYDLPRSGAVMDELGATNARFALASTAVTDLYAGRDLDAALDLHIESEHEISHELEDTLNLFIADSVDSVVDETEAF